MARHPDWFERLDAIIEVVRHANPLEWLGRHEIRAVFDCSERDGIRLLHKFGAGQHDNALSVSRSDLLAQLEAIRSDTTYGAFLRQRQQVAKQLSAARAEAASREFRVMPKAPDEQKACLEDLPGTITWRRGTGESGRFEILYADGADLMRQLAEFLRAAGVNREEFFAATGPPDGSSR